LLIKSYVSRFNLIQFGKNFVDSIRFKFKLKMTFNLV